MDCGHVNDFGSLHIASEADTIEGNTFQREMLKPDWITPLFLIKRHWAKLPQNLSPSQEHLQEASHHDLSPAVDNNSTLMPFAFRRRYLRWKKLPSPVPPVQDSHDSCIFFLRSRSVGSRARSMMILCQYRRRTQRTSLIALSVGFSRRYRWRASPDYDLGIGGAEFWLRWAKKWSRLDKLLLNKPFYTTAKITGKA